MRAPRWVVIRALLLAAVAASAGCRGASSDGEEVAARCGDGRQDPGEACDDGNADPGDGCEPETCQYSCADPGADCAAPPACRRAACSAGHVCAPVGDAALDGTPCAAGRSCRAGECVAPGCGDGVVDGSAGEECEPPGTATCDASCHARACGDGVIDAGEQCDDGNRANLDGCDSACRYEVVLRATALALRGTAAPAGCTPATNRLGAEAVTGAALPGVNAAMAESLDDGTTNLLLQLLGLDDLTGAADADGLSLGVLGGVPDPSRGAWPGPHPLDWAFLADPAGLTADDRPATLWSGAALVARRLTAGPGDVSLPLALGGAPFPIRLRSARLTLTLDGTPAPDVPGPPPAALAPGLVVFRTATGSAAGQGLCGNVTVESLARMPVPDAFASGGATACSAACLGSRAYTSCGVDQPVGAGCNSLLDVLVGGCRVTFPLCVAAVEPAQPDVPAVAGGTVTALALGAGNKVPAGLTAGNLDAYSAYFRVDANRVHLTGRR